MKKVLLVCFCLLLVTQLFGGVVERVISLPESELFFGKEFGYDVVFLPRAFSVGEIGSPFLPAVNIKILIPANATGSKVEILYCEKTQIKGKFNVLPEQPPVMLNSTVVEEFVEPDQKVYNSIEPYPGKLVSKTIHTGTKCGYRIVDFSVYPLQYIPKEKRLVFYTKMEIRLSYDEGTHMVKPVSERQKEVFGKTVSQIVINKEDLQRFAPPVRNGRGPYGDWEMVIIAPNDADMIDSLNVLAYWKTKKGVQCMIKNVQDIYDDYSGTNKPWDIKRFITDMVSDSGTIWVFLFGDSAASSTDGIACRGVWYTDGTDLPTERYFEDLDNNWNYDGDTRYGEHTDGPGGGELDWYADCYVGRAFPPAGSEATTGKYVRRILWFEKTPAADFATQAMFSSCELFSSSSYGYARTDDMASHIPGGWYMPGQANGHPGFEYLQGVNDYPGDQSFLQSELSDGYEFYGSSAHGSYSVFMADYSTNSINTTEISDWFDPGMRCGIFTANSCLWGGFDQADCCAEFLYHFGMTGGACNSRSGWGYDSNYLPYIHLLSDGICWQFFVQVFDNDVYHLGEAVAAVKDYFAGDIGDDYWNWCLKEYNTYGDPELPMWNASSGPQTFTVTHADTVSGPSFSIDVTDASKAPVLNARVCLWCKAENTLWARGYTDGAGNVTISVNPTIDDDTMWVTVTKHNYIPYEGFAIVDYTSICLTAFEVTANKGGVKVYWRTESEVDNAYWVIERAVDLKGEWGIAGTTEGQGTKPTPTDYEYMDKAIDKDGEYYYRLVSIDGGGNKETYGPIKVKVSGFVPRVYALGKVYPNPFSRQLVISYDIPKSSNVSLRIYDVSGRVVRTLINGKKAANYHSTKWDAKGDGGKSVGYGVYFLRMDAGSYTKTQKLLYVR